MFHDQGAGESTTTSTSAFPTKCPVSFCLKERRTEHREGRGMKKEWHRTGIKLSIIILRFQVLEPAEQDKL